MKAYWFNRNNRKAFEDFFTKQNIRFVINDNWIILL